MRKWEDILSGYLEGTDSRADAEALQMRIQLPSDDRAEVEMTLRLVDVISQALTSTLPAKFAGSRLIDAIHETPVRPVPSGWRLESGRMVAAAAGTNAEDVINSIMEGTCPAEGELGANEVERLKGLITSERAPQGAVDRLLSRLRSEQDKLVEPMHDHAPKGERGRAWQPLRRPDVLAASTDVEGRQDDPEKEQGSKD